MPFVAFKLPNLLLVAFAEGAFSQAFAPILAEYKSKQGEDATRVFVSYARVADPALATAHCYRMAAPWVITITAPGFADTADKFALTTSVAYYLSLYFADPPGFAGGAIRPH